MLKVTVEHKKPSSLVKEGKVLRRRRDNKIFMVVRGNSGNINLVGLNTDAPDVGKVIYYSWTAEEDVDLTAFEEVEAELKVKF